jgi:hypothetical protein
MSGAEDWATAVRFADWLHHASRGVAKLDGPGRVIELLTGNTVLCGGPTETFSRRMPTYCPAPDEEHLAPIDVLYGRYDPERLLIEIFINRIRTDASRFDCSATDLLTVVRVHEYAHAIVHVGLDAENTEEQLETFGPEGNTDWRSFNAKRNKAFSALDDNAHELLAQAITWACLCGESLQPRSRELAETFLSLEKHQPLRYRLAPEVKLRACSADWRLVLAAARREIDVYRPDDFHDADGLTALIKRSGGHRGSIEFSEGESLGPVVAELQGRLAAVDLASRQMTSDPSLELLVLRKEHTELRMYKEAAHRRPHFHIEYKKEFAASYALDNFERLAGYMPKRYEDAILPLARAKRDQLIERWSSLNNTFKVVVAGEDCT